MQPKVGQIWSYLGIAYWLITSRKDNGGYNIYNLKSGKIDWSYMNTEGDWKLIQDVP